MSMRVKSSSSTRLTWTSPIWPTCPSASVFWVTRAKDNLQCRVVRKLQDGTVRQHPARRPDCPDQPAGASRLSGRTAPRRGPGRGGRRTARNGFPDQQPDWSAQTIADLYRCRWSIEVFFKELKQTLQLADFLGHSANAVRWQVWTALLAYVLLRFCAYLGQWGHSFTRLFALIRSALWQNWELRSLLEVYGTAGGGGRFLGTPATSLSGGLRLILWDSRGANTMNS